MTDVRDDVALFAERVLRRPLWSHQLDVARSDRFIAVVAAARRTGKTTLAETLAIHTAFRDRDVRVLCLSATQDSARRLTESIAATLNAHKLTRGAVVDDFATRIRLSNGSEIVSLPPSQRQIRGYGRDVRLVILDEAGFMPSDTWTAAHYTALDERPQSRILMIGTPWGAPEHFFRRAHAAGRDGDADHATFHWAYKVNPQLDHAYLERQRERVSPVEYAAEVLGEWSDAMGSLFPRELLYRQTLDLELPALAELQPPARGIVGVDWGVSFDRSAAAVIYRLPVAQVNPGLPAMPRFVVLPTVWPAKKPLDDVVNAVGERWRCFEFISTETTGVGAMPSQELRRRIGELAADGDLRRSWNFVATTNAKKTAGYGCILSLLERGQLFLPRHPDLLRQLAGLRFEQGDRGFTHIGAEDAAVHDDVADALMLASLPFSPRTAGRPVCWLARLASEQRAPADTSVLYQGETVTSDAGLVVWRKPPLQSVTGGEVTYPPEYQHPIQQGRVGKLTIRRST